MTREEKSILIQLLALEPFWGAASIKQLQQLLQKEKISLVDFWQTPTDLGYSRLLTANRVHAIRSWQAKFAHDDFSFYLQERKIKTCLVTDDEYPALLRFIPDYPFGFFYQGDLRCLRRPTLAVVGARQMTNYGQKVIEKLLTHQLRGLTIISGLMMGVDEAAHRRALALGLPTTAVLGYGLNLTWPSYLRDLRLEILQRDGLVISEYAPWSVPKAFRFPLRNRLVAGLSLGTLVVEAAAKSGSLITANLALDDGREVFIVPGSIFSDLSNGTLSLWQNGALPVSQTSEIIEALLANQVADLPADFYQVLQAAAAIKPVIAPTKQFAQPLQNQIYQLLQTADLSSEELNEKIVNDSAEIAMQLSLLELAGEIKQKAQKWQICVH